jgi:alkylation response protein AidB-like acyl-CoA dehydrogenase
VSDLESLRGEVREWLEENCPPSMRQPMDIAQAANWGGRKREFYEDAEDGESWMRAMASRGFTAPTWPKEYGGGGLSDPENRVLQQELRRITARPALSSIGLIMLGPLLLEEGSEEQKREHLPKITDGSIRWCQGYSEPAAGSDLASLQMRCEDRGDHYTVTGQKIWTSYADKSDMIFCLVRSDPNAAKHDGISFVLVDMDQPGVTTSPIQLISGYSPFCQTFFEEARVEKRNLVGAWNGGWSIAKRLLQFERQSIGSMGQASRNAKHEAPLHELAKRYRGERDGRVADARLRDRIARIAMEAHCLGSTQRRSMDEARSGSPVGAASSIFKYCATEGNKDKQELRIEILGMQGLGWEGDGFAEEELTATRRWLRSKANSIEGGTSEVQLNIIAKRVLGLPD